MNAIQIIETVKRSGGRLWGVGDKLRYRAPAEIITPLLPDIKTHKAAILEYLKPKLAAANDNVLPTPRRAVVYKVTVAGKRMTVIDTAAEPCESFVKGIYAQFGIDRVEAIEKQ